MNAALEQINKISITLH